MTRIGHPYDDDPNTPFNELEFRYVEVTDSIGRRHRYFYVEPTVELGEEITTAMIIGSVQDLRKIYPKITCHVHYEITDPNGKYLNPNEV